MIMPFGNYKGDEMDDVPASYLLWLFENDIARGDIREYILKNMNGIKKQIQEGRGDQ